MISFEDLEDAAKRFCEKEEKAAYTLAKEGDLDQIRIMFNGDPSDTDVYLWLENGRLKCSNLDFGLGFGEWLKPTESPIINDDPRGAKYLAQRQEKSRNEVVVKPHGPIRDIQVQELTFEDIKKFICSAASDKDAYMFLKLCQARNLNPFTNEAFLIPYKDSKTGEIKCSMVVGKEAFMRKAEANPLYRGFKAGIIVSIGDEINYREGTFQRKGEILEGGWAEVYRSDREYPIRSEVSLSEYGSERSLWKSKPATMIRKIAIVQAHREAFPSDLSGCYDSSEMGIDPEKEI